MTATNEILQFTNTSLLDESIESYQYHSIDPVIGTDYNKSGEIRINIELQAL